MVTQTWDQLEIGRRRRVRGKGSGSRTSRRIGDVETRNYSLVTIVVVGGGGGKGERRERREGSGTGKREAREWSRGLQKANGVEGERGRAGNTRIAATRGGRIELDWHGPGTGDWTGRRVGDARSGRWQWVDCALMGTSQLAAGLLSLSPGP